MSHTNRSKEIGTAAESKVVKFLAENGFGGAERRALRGTQDVGDVTGTPGLVWEVKGGHAAWAASDNQLDAWLAETELERARANASFGVLVVARERKNVRDWWALFWLDQLVSLAGGSSSDTDADAVSVPVRSTLAHAVGLLRKHGWGDSA